jgi:Sigma-70, region 4
VKIHNYLKSPSPFLQRLLGRKVEPDTVDEGDLPEGILAVLADKPQQALAAAFRCRPLKYGQIAILMGVSRDRVRQLETRAADTLRRASRFRQLCRFIPGWQNALRLRPEHANALLPGETFPLEYRRKRKLQTGQSVSALQTNKSRQKPSSPKQKKSNNRSSVFSHKKKNSSAKSR